MKAVQNNVCIDKKMIRYSRDSIMQSNINELISYKLRNIIEVCDKAVGKYKVARKTSKKPLFEEGTLESLLDTMKLKIDDNERE